MIFHADICFQDQCYDASCSTIAVILLLRRPAWCSKILQNLASRLNILDNHFKAMMEDLWSAAMRSVQITCLDKVDEYEQSLGQSGGSLPGPAQSLKINQSIHQPTIEADC